MYKLHFDNFLINEHDDDSARDARRTLWDHGRSRAILPNCCSKLFDFKGVKKTTDPENLLQIRPNTYKQKNKQTNER